MFSSKSLLTTALSLLTLTTLTTSIPDPNRKSGKPLFTPFNNITIFQSPPDYTSPGTLYARTALIPGSEALLATWENYSPQPPLVYFPIYKSVNGGKKWTHISNVTDQVNGWGMRYQPFLYVMPQRIGNYEAGTLLCAGNSIPEDLSQTKIDVYASRDDGYTWHFVSSVARGGEAVPDNGLTPIWEPFIMTYDNQIVVFYSDQRDNATYGQKLVHQTSTNLKTWGPVVNDVAYPVYTDRPGMTTVTHLPNGKYMMTYEFGGGPLADGSTTYEFPVYYRISDSPLTFNEAEGLPIVSQDGTQPTSSPYITWSPVGGPNGTILVSSGSYSEIFTNTKLGDVNSWVKTSTNGAKISYTRSLRVMPDPTKLLIAGGGLLPPSENNSVTVSMINIK